ncbi:hypothetical protein EBU99_10565 [bacterium]|nr:hypothetical protein [bacterium]
MTVLDLIQAHPYPWPEVSNIERHIEFDLPANLSDVARWALIDDVQACEDFAEWVECGLWKSRWIVKPIKFEGEERCYGADVFLQSVGYMVCYTGNGVWRVEKDGGQVWLLNQPEIINFADNKGWDGE